MFSELDKLFMKKALKCAKLGKSKVDPNPLVGCVIVKNKKILATGYHHQFGHEHAEVDAIKKLNANQLKNATLYVTLEPCSHFGKTPPCADLIIKSKISKVYVGCVDPNPLVNHQGIQKLKDAGIEVFIGLLEKECLELNKKFFYSVKNKKPYILAKYAITTDGKIATKSLDSKWISNEKSRLLSNALRSEYMGIMVGINTILYDDPQLTCRIPNKRSPTRIILDTYLKLPLNSFVVTDAINHQTIVLTNENNSSKIELYKQRHVNVVYIKNVENGLLDINECLTKIYELGINSILVEGGSQLLGSLLTSRNINELICFVGNKLIGGTQSLGPIGGIGFDKIKDATYLELINVKKIENNVMLHYVVQERK